MTMDYRKLTYSLSALMGAGLLLGAASVAAAPVTYFGEDTSTAGISLGPNSTEARDDFLANLSGVGTEDFESFAFGDDAPLELTFPGTGGDLTASLTGTGYIDGASTGRFATSGEKFWVGTTGSFAIDFANPISAFGFNGIDIGDFVTEQMVMNLTSSEGEVSQLTVPHSLNIGNTSQATLFSGFIDQSETYSRIEFTNAGGGDYFAFDDMVIGDAGQITPVPEPSLLAMFGLGLLGLGVVRRRRLR